MKIGEKREDQQKSKEKNNGGKEMKKSCTNIK